MMNWKLSGSTALALTMLCSGAQAQVTPEEVWQSWQALVTGAGQELTVASEKRNGETLEVKGVVLTFKDEQGGSFAANLDTLDFTDQGDGTVKVTMADSYPLTFAFPPGEADAPSSMALTVTQPGLSLVAGGSATETTYDYNAPSVTIKLDEVKDKDGKVSDVAADAVLTNVAGTYNISAQGEATGLKTEFTAKSAAINFSGKNPETTSDVKVAFSMADLAGRSNGTLLGAEIMANMAAALNAGFTVDSGFTYGAMTFTVDVTDPTGPTNIAGSATGGGVTLAMDKARVNYGTSLNGASIKMSGAQIPFPEVALNFAESGFNVLIPASKSDTPKDFAFLTKLVDFTISDEVWGIFDPAGTLSREPATIVLDAKGTGFWKQDIMDPNVKMDEIEAPGELTSLDLTQALVKAAGAEVAATGALTFDNTDLVTFQGMPAPTGTIDVTIKGVNKLIDNLIAIGILPEDQAMGARMMLGMFARPGAGPDELTSTLEFKDKGFFANGQRLQ